MKTKILIVPLLIITFFACSGDEKPKENEPEIESIIGKWQLIEVYRSDGGGASNWSSVENGYEYTFKENGIFYSNRFNECSEGEYSISSNQLTLDYNCNGFSTGIESPEGTFVENIKIENNFMFLSPTYMNCDEGCENKFAKEVK